MFTNINTAIYAGIEGHLVSVELVAIKGVPRFNIVGLPSATVMESRERIRAAIVNSSFDYPRGKITINLTPANLRKNGSHLDLPIAVGLLCVDFNIDPVKAAGYGIIGELSLDGRVLGVDGVLPMVLTMAKEGIKKVIVPTPNYYEANIVDDIEVIPCNSLIECAGLINGALEPRHMEDSVQDEEVYSDIDFNQIHGQENAKRAIVVAVTGGHGLIMVGSPGCGKTMLSKRIPTIMPPMNKEEIIETSILYSVSGKLNLNERLITKRPFRSPHNTIGVAGLIGGGCIPVPGELSLAHNGILFLDEVAEFSRVKIEALRIPLEDKKISHFRNGTLYTFPCNFSLVMATNPCKCGYYGNDKIMCKCSPRELMSYRQRLSGPIMDRIDIKLEMDTVDYKEITQNDDEGLGSEEMAKLVRRGKTFALRNGREKPNGSMEDVDIKKYCALGPDEKALMENAYKALKLSPRAYMKVLKVARTIADIDESEEIKTEHLAEALGYRIFSENEEAQYG